MTSGSLYTLTSLGWFVSLRQACNKRNTATETMKNEASSIFSLNELKTASGVGASE